MARRRVPKGKSLTVEQQRRLGDLQDALALRVGAMVAMRTPQTHEEARTSFEVYERQLAEPHSTWLRREMNSILNPRKKKK